MRAARLTCRAPLACLLATTTAACGSYAVTPPQVTSTAGPAVTTTAPAPPAAVTPTSAAATLEPTSTVEAAALPDPVLLDVGASPVLPWRVGRSLEVGGTGQALVARDAVFVVNERDRAFTGDLPDGEIAVVDPASMTIATTVEHAIGGFPIVADDAIWLINAEFGQTVTRVDLDTLDVARFSTSPEADPTPEAIAYAGGYIWVGNNHEGSIAKINPGTLALMYRIRVADPGEFGVRGRAASDGQSAFFGISREGTIVRIDAASGREVSRLVLPLVPHDTLPEGVDQSQSSSPETLLSIGDELWVRTLDRIYVIDMTRAGDETIVAALATTGPWDTALVSDGQGSIWTLAYEPTTIVQIDMAARSIVGRFSAKALGTGFGRVVPVRDRMLFRTEGRLIEVDEAGSE